MGRVRFLCWICQERTNSREGAKSGANSSSRCDLSHSSCVQVLLLLYWQYRPGCLSSTWRNREPGVRAAGGINRGDSIELLGSTCVTTSRRAKKKNTILYDRGYSPRLYRCCCCWCPEQACKIPGVSFWQMVLNFFLSIFDFFFLFSTFFFLLGKSLRECVCACSCWNVMYSGVCV